MMNVRMIVILAATAFATAAVSAGASSNAPSSAPAEKLIPLQQIVKRAQALRPGKLLESEIETWEGTGYVYEVELLDDEGVVWEMYFDARTGRLLETSAEREDDEDTDSRR